MANQWIRCCIAKGCLYEFSAEIIALNSNRAYCLKISRQISMKLAIREINLITFLSESKKLRQEKKHQLF